mgnify:CR=1 FL=1
MDKWLTSTSPAKQSPSSPESKDSNDTVIARLPESKLSELWQHVLDHRITATNVSSSCWQLPCFPLGGGVKRKDVAAVDTEEYNRYSLNQKMYVQIKTSTVKQPRPPNEKLQLHHLAIWFHPNEEYQTHARKMLKDGKGKLEVSHLCNFKFCCNPEHFRLESSDINKSRTSCVVYVRATNNRWYHTCTHQPLCIYTHQSKILELAGDGLELKPAPWSPPVIIPRMYEESLSTVVRLYLRVYMYFYFIFF